MTTTTTEPAAIVASIPAEAAKIGAKVALMCAKLRDVKQAKREAAKKAREALQMTDAWQAAKEIKDQIKADTKTQREEIAAYLREARTDTDYVNAAHAAEVLAEQVRTLSGLIDADANDARQMLLPFAREVGA